MSHWYYLKGQERHGPISEQELQDLINSGVLRPDSLIWTQGWEEWKPARSKPGLFPEPPPLPAVIPVEQVSDVEPIEEDQEAGSKGEAAHRLLKNGLIISGFSLLGYIVLLFVINSISNDFFQAIGGFLAVLGLLLLMAFALFLTFFAKHMERATFLRGQWFPVEPDYPSLKFTEDKTLVRSDGLAAKYQFSVADDTLRLTDERGRVTIIKVLSLSKQDLVLILDGRSVCYKRTPSFSRQQASGVSSGGEAAAQPGKAAGEEVAVNANVTVLSKDPLVIEPVLDENKFVQDESGQKYVNFYCGNCHTHLLYPATVIGQQVHCGECGVVNQLPHDVAQGLWSVLKLTGMAALGLVDAAATANGRTCSQCKTVCPGAARVCYACGSRLKTINEVLFDE